MEPGQAKGEVVQQIGELRGQMELAVDKIAEELNIAVCVKSPTRRTAVVRNERISRPEGYRSAAL